MLLQKKHGGEVNCHQQLPSSTIGRLISCLWRATRTFCQRSNRQIATARVPWQQNPPPLSLSLSTRRLLWTLADMEMSLRLLCWRQQPRRVLLLQCSSNTICRTVRKSLTVFKCSCSTLHGRFWEQAYMWKLW